MNCGRRRVVNTRTPDGPLCPTCPPLPASVCSICAQQRPCGTSRLTGLPWCPSCQRQSARCVRCGRLEPIRSGTLTEPICQGCTVAAFPDCAACESSPQPGRCPDCRLELRLQELFTDPDGATHPALRPLKQALAATDPPGTALRWLARKPVAAALADIAAGRRELTHAYRVCIRQQIDSAADLGSGGFSAVARIDADRPQPEVADVTSVPRIGLAATPTPTPTPTPTARGV